MPGAIHQLFIPKKHFGPLFINAQHRADGTIETHTNAQKCLLKNKYESENPFRDSLLKRHVKIFKIQHKMEKRRNERSW